MLTGKLILRIYIEMKETKKRQEDLVEEETQKDFYYKMSW